jgi:hypothetical protein
MKNKSAISKRGRDELQRMITKSAGQSKNDVIISGRKRKAGDTEPSSQIRRINSPPISSESLLAATGRNSAAFLMLVN